jgi:ribosome modulation factor
MRLITFNLSLGAGAKVRHRDDDPWIEGYEARVALQARSANPYNGPDSHRLWDDGWMEAQEEETRNAPSDRITPK